MSHNDLFWAPSIQDGLWVPNPSQLKILDTQTSKAVNGIDGGTWSPTRSITIGGSGIQITNVGILSGGVSTGTSALPGALNLGPSGYPSFGVPRTRKIVFQVNGYTGSAHNVFDLLNPTIDYSIPGRVTALPGNTNLFLNMMLPNLNRFPAGFTFSEVRVRFQVGVKPTSVPVTANLPTIKFGTNVAGGQDTLVMPTPASTDAYYNKGLPQDLVLTPTHVTTSQAGAQYYVSITDLANTQNSYFAFSITLANITDMRPGL